MSDHRYPCRACAGKGTRVYLLEEDAGSYEAVCDFCEGTGKGPDRRKRRDRRNRSGPVLGPGMKPHHSDVEDEHGMDVSLDKQMATAFRQYQAALNDASYWHSEQSRERNKHQVGEAFDALVKLTNTILGDR